MISYNPKDWLRFIFEFHKSDTVRKLFPIIIVLSLYSYGVAVFEMEYLQLSENSQVKNIPVMHSLLGFAISMLLVFRTNTAYDRWWEGRKLWGGLVNNSRNLSLKLNLILQSESDKELFKQLIPQFAVVLKAHLQSDITRLELDNLPHPEIKNFDTSKHLPSQVVNMMMKRVNELYKEGKITNEQLLILNNELTSFLDICGACERIKNTPIPYSYSAFIKKFIFLYVMTLPFGFVFNLGYIMIPVVAFIFYVLASLEIIAEEIEDPFGKDDNDLPMERLAVTIKKNVEEIFN
ncbi:bestrophin family protein [Aridibaculum aurantiacum]|uniref:bestrophin family protein n=1 Tax=Aridibaculum aurantiacum TaxID=2810307 RepID=UPI001A969912|nr:bestrophin family ion channel [Aridibaculum aurantiacum]